MIAAHLLVSIVAALVGAGTTLLLGHSVPMAIGAYAIGGALGLLVTAATQICLSLLRDEGDATRRDQAAWTARLIREATDAGLSGDAAQVLPFRRVVTATRTPASSTGDPRLQPGWAHPPNSWPDEIPETLRLRLLDAMSYDSATVADIWDELTGWLVEQGIDGPLSHPGRPGANTPEYSSDRMVH